MDYVSSILYIMLSPEAHTLRVYIHYGEAILGLNNRTHHPLGLVRFW